ncbi:MAG: hydrogenase maturation protease [Deltaproteobacteria bacterium]|nr:hydrogenase maturation protease [Deltaproteobacteria bacterium]
MGSKTLVLGLGNTILSDDGVGLLVARDAERLLRDRQDVDVRCTSLGGFDLVDLLAGYGRAIIVDAVKTGAVPPGTTRWFSPWDFAVSKRLVAMHEVSLPDALALGRKLGADMPREIRILGIEVENDQTFGDQCSPLVAAAVPRAVFEVIERVGEEPSPEAKCDDPVEHPN